MSRLVETLESVLGRLTQEFDRDASVMVQFPAGDWAAIKQATRDARAQMSVVDMHNIADAAGVVSHTSTGQPLPVDARMDEAIDSMLPYEGPIEATAPVDPPAPVEPPVEPPVTPVDPPALGGQP